MVTALLLPQWILLAEAAGLLRSWVKSLECKGLKLISEINRGHLIVLL